MVMQHRGQVTIFIIAAVVIVLGISLFYFIGSDSENNSSGNSVVDDAILECVTFMTDTSYQFVPYQGGYHTPPQRFFNFSPTFFPYYYYEGQSLIPSLQDIEKEMGAFVNDNLGDCFNSMERAGFEVSYEPIVTTVTIAEDDVTYTVDTVVTLTRDGQAFRVDTSTLDPMIYESKLYYLYDAAAFFVADQVEDSEFYCISCITRMAETHGFRFYIMPLVDEVYFVTVFTEGEDPTILNFVAKYKEGKVEEDSVL